MLLKQVRKVISFNDHTTASRDDTVKDKLFLSISALKYSQLRSHLKCPLAEVTSVKGEQEHSLYINFCLDAVKKTLSFL